MFVFMTGFLLDVGIHTLEWQLFSLFHTQNIRNDCWLYHFRLFRLVLLALLFEQAGDMIIRLNLCLV